MILTQGSIPEVLETSIGEGLKGRHARLGTAALSSYPLGPADLVSLYKYIPTDPNQHPVNNDTTDNNEDPLAQIKKKLEVGTHFYNSGIDTSDPTSIAVFCKSIKDAIEEDNQQLWYGKQRHFKVGHIVYSTYNCFSQCDINVVVKFPGNIETYLTTKEDGDIILKEGQHDSNEELWLETFVSGIVRSFTQIMDNAKEGELNNIVETKIYNPLLMNDINDIAELFILKGFPLCYDRGFVLGAPVDCIGTTHLNNYLIEVYSKIVAMSGYHELALKKLDEMIQYEKYKDLKYLKARILYENDFKLKSLELINEELKNKFLPNGIYKNQMLLLQIEILYSIIESKKTQFLPETDSKEIAKLYQTINKLSKTLCKILPSEFKPWYWLVKSYTGLNDFENALLSLNSCPMNMTKDKYNFKRMDTSLMGVTANGSSTSGAAQASSGGSSQSLSGGVQQNASNASSSGSGPSNGVGAERMHLPLPVDVVLDEVTGLNSQDVITEHSHADKTLMNLPGSSLKTTYSIAYSLLVDIANLIGWEKLLIHRSNIFVMEDEFHNLANRRSSKVSQDGVDENDHISNGAGGEGRSFLKDDKRLCERWLDNLFMLLYQDMKQYTMWQAEQIQFESSGTEYIRSTFEWELLGLLANRLKHYNEGSLAFQMGLKQRFSGVCCKKLIMYYLKEKSKILQNYSLKSGVILHNVNQLNQLLLDLVVKNIVWNHRWYTEFSINLHFAAKSLIEQDYGLEKLENEIKSKYSQEVFELCYDNVLKFFNDEEEY